MTQDISDMQSRILAIHFRENGTNVSSTEIDFLDFIQRTYGESNASFTDIANRTKLSEDFIDFIVSGLETNDFVKRNSPTVSITRKGEEFLAMCHELIPEVDNIIANNSFLASMSNVTRSITDTQA